MISMNDIRSTNSIFIMAVVFLSSCENDSHKYQASDAPPASTTSLPFPDYPSKFEGCVADDNRTSFAVSRNEGKELLGIHSQIQTPEQGWHAMMVYYGDNGAKAT